MLEITRAITPMREAFKLVWFVFCFFWLVQLAAPFIAFCPIRSVKLHLKGPLCASENGLAVQGLQVVLEVVAVV